MSNKKIPRAVIEALDFDYLDDLPPDAYEFMTKFIDEYYFNNFTKRPLHKNPKQRREVMRDNNARRRDVYNHAWFADDEWNEDDT